MRVRAQYALIVRLSKNVSAASTPYASFEPGCVWLLDRPVKMTPMLLRRKRSRFKRTTEKFVDRAADTGASSVWMLSNPTLNGPTRPVSRPPTSMGTSRPAFNPIRRL